MTPGDRKAFVEVVIGFAELKGKQLSAPALELYWRAMQRWSLDDFRVAAEQLLRACEFMPVPKDFEDLKRAQEPTAGEAWDAVLLGRGTLTERAKRAGQIAANGRYIGHLDIERELPHVQRRFMEIYRELTDVEETREAVPQLANRERSKGLTHVGQLRRQLPQVLAEARQHREPRDDRAPSREHSGAVLADGDDHEAADDE